MKNLTINCNDIQISNDKQICLIAGPCQLETEQHALDMILRSKKVSGPRALEIGLVHEVWSLEELKPAAISLAHELAAQPAKAVESMMKVLVNSSDRDLEDLLKAERQAVKDNSGTKDSQEGMAAFMEKRKPIFNQ